MVKTFSLTSDVWKGIPPEQKEKVESILNAVLQYYEISLDDFFQLKSMAIINIRYECFFLMKEIADFNFADIGRFLSFDRQLIRYGFEKTAWYKINYPQSKRNLEGIIKICNGLQKKYVWLIPE